MYNLDYVTALILLTSCVAPICIVQGFILFDEYKIWKRKRDASLSISHLLKPSTPMCEIVCNTNDKKLDTHTELENHVIIKKLGIMEGQVYSSN